VRGVRHRATALAALVLATVAIGCGREPEPDVVAGKELFVQKCGSCHALSRANSQGVTGPDLDAAFASARREGMNEDTVAGIVREQIANPRASSSMPADLVKGEQAEDVAAYVAQVAGQPGEDEGRLATAGQPKVASKPVAAKNGRLQLDADPSGALAFSSSKATAPAGPLTLVMDNPAQIQHNIALRGGGIDEQGAVVGNGGTSTVEATVRQGRFVFYCSVPGHEAGGMKGDLTVE
jgi:mono/diheme cytochrome c family protein